MAKHRQKHKRRVCVLCQKQEIGDEYHYSIESHFLNIKKNINKTGGVYRTQI